MRIRSIFLVLAAHMQIGLWHQHLFVKMVVLIDPPLKMAELLLQKCIQSRIWLGKVNRQLITTSDSNVNNTLLISKHKTKQKSAREKRNYHHVHVVVYSLMECCTPHGPSWRPAQASNTVTVYNKTLYVIFSIVKASRADTWEAIYWNVSKKMK